MIRLSIKILGGIVLFIISIVTGYCLLKYYQSEKLYSLLGPSPTIMTQENFTFRDLNKNGSLDVYEDSRESVDKRVEDLLSQMTIEDKAGQMFILSLIHI